MVTECLESNKKTILIIVFYPTILTIVACSIYFGIKATRSKPEIKVDEELYLLVGNRVCDDATNTNAFEFDGGDCCFQPLVRGDCVVCKCYENGIIYSTTTITTSTTTTQSLALTTTEMKTSTSKF